MLGRSAAPSRVAAAPWGFRWLVRRIYLKQKTAYAIVDCDWSSDVCSSDLNCDYFKNINFRNYIRFPINIKSDEDIVSTYDRKDRKSVV